MNEFGKRENYNLLLVDGKLYQLTKKNNGRYLHIEPFYNSYIDLIVHFHYE